MKKLPDPSQGSGRKRGQTLDDPRWRSSGRPFECLPLRAGRQGDPFESLSERSIGVRRADRVSRGGRLNARSPRRYTDATVEVISYQMSVVSMGEAKQ